MKKLFQKRAIEHWHVGVSDKISPLLLIIINFFSLKLIGCQWVGNFLLLLQFYYVVPEMIRENIFIN